MISPRKHKNGYHWVAPDYEWLDDQYWTQAKSTYIIAEELGCSSVAVGHWLRALDIPRRTPSQAQSRRFHRIGDLSEGGYRDAARKMLQVLRVPQVCALCGTGRGWIEVHHVDGNWRNNAPTNLWWLCRRCHNRLHRGWFSRGPTLVPCTWQAAAREIRKTLVSKGG